MKKLILIITILLSVPFLGFTVQASQTYDLEKNFNHYVEDTSYYEIDNISINCRTYVNFNSNKCHRIYLKSFQKFNSSVVTQKYIKVTLQKFVNSNWINIAKYKMYKDVEHGGYLGKLEDLIIGKGQYRFSFESLDNTVKFKTLEYHGFSFFKKKSLAEKMKYGMFDYVQVNKKKGISVNEKCYEWVSYDTPQNQWAKFKIKKKSKGAIGIRANTVSGKVKIVLYNPKNKKVYSKTFTSKNKYGIVKSITLKKGTYYWKVTRMTKDTVSNIMFGKVDKWNKKYKSMKYLKNRYLDDGIADICELIEYQDGYVYDFDWVLQWSKNSY